jgi:hypothetical protein
MRSAAKALLACLLFAGLVASPARAAPVIAAAGAISCDPADPDFNSGLGVSGFCRQQRTADLIAGNGYDAVLALGDQQYQAGTLENYLASYDLSWGHFKAKTHPIPGNHEYEDPAGGAEGYFDYWNGVDEAAGAAGTRGEGWYSFNLGKWHLIALNSNCGSVACGANSSQVQWLNSDLAAHPNKCVLAYHHFSRFSSGRDGNYGGVLPIWNALYAAGADVVLVGQAHDYERFRPQTPAGEFDRAHGIREFVVGTGGRSKHEFVDVKPNSRVRLRNFGVLRLRLLKSGYRWRFRNPGGQLLDSGETGCHSAP